MTFSLSQWRHPGCWLPLLSLPGPRQSLRGVRPRDQRVEWHRQARTDGDIGQKFI